MVMVASDVTVPSALIVTLMSPLVTVAVATGGTAFRPPRGFAGLPCGHTHQTAPAIATRMSPATIQPPAPLRRGAAGAGRVGASAGFVCPGHASVLVRSSMLHRTIYPKPEVCRQLADTIGRRFVGQGSGDQGSCGSRALGGTVFCTKVHASRARMSATFPDH